MLLLVDEKAELSSAERRFADWIRWSPAQPGIALLDVAVPFRGRSRQLDALIWTRQRCVAVEVKGFRSRQDGVLVVPPNGPWRMDDGRVADLYGNEGGHNPIEQARINSLATKDWVNGVTGREHVVHGLVLVMLHAGQDVPSLEAQAHPPMTDIIVEDFDVFRYYLHTLGTQKARWDAEQVDTLITGLGLAHLYDGRRDIIAAALEQTAP